MTAIEIVNLILVLLSQFFRFVGMAILGLGIGWLALDLLKKVEAWQGQIAIFLGLAGLIIAMTIFTGWGALGAFAIGVGVALLMWGMPKKQKKDEEKKS
jgi:NhaP-type Na+/H+ or K+/H+ antiporter